MQKQTSSPLTAKNPRLSAVQIDLHNAEDRARDLFSSIETHYERSVLQLNAKRVLTDLSELTALLVKTQDALAQCGESPADPGGSKRKHVTPLSNFDYENELMAVKSKLHFLAYAIEQSFDGMERQGEPREPGVIGYGASLCFREVLQRLDIIEAHVLQEL